MGRWLSYLILAEIFFTVVPSAVSSDPPLSPSGVNDEVAALMMVKSKIRDDRGGWTGGTSTPWTPAPGIWEMADTGLSGSLSMSIGSLNHLKTMLQQEMIIKVASLLLVFAMAGVICSGSRLLAVEGNHEDSTAARHEKQADFLPVESAGDADAAASDPADADNHHSLPRQSFGDWGNHQDQFDPLVR
ncbi:putative LRR receptor-like serine/threonine-protein kinase [Apostasia shenzhenica]|uniref:Putative LRR receptor-like serine/threonine-protein kinase n=1 Tax=Apostasia shenzhenica TaxID=1088818 RepID=A0A2I0A6A1_9ASPA|nr:putative LRR receptor-like serine/threonine-protein kinase [Apostasia shenzhenica]